MNETRYLISETAKITQVEPHVLRYWEEELGLAIRRNEMGHRYYTEKDIQTFMTIKELKKKGLQLRAIRREIEQEDQDVNGCGGAGNGTEQEIKAERTETAEWIGKTEKAGRTEGIGKTEKAGRTERIGKTEKAGSAERIEKTERIEKIRKIERTGKAEKSKEQRFGEIMERLIHDIELGERKEGRYRRLDEAIRKRQQSRKMVAATEENVKRKKKRKNKK